MDTQIFDDRSRELQEFLQSGIGVKGLVDSGLVKIPEIFINPPETSPDPPSGTGQTDLQVPVIDFTAVDGDRRGEIVGQVRDASQTWGIFQIVNHGVPAAVMEEMLDGVKRFQEQPVEAKKEWYARGGSGQATYAHYAKKFTAALWRDSFACYFRDGQLEEEAMPRVCRETINEYMKCIIKLKETLSELLSEALGLKSNHLSQIRCMDSAYFLCNYYPACPEPGLVTGTGSHSDPAFLTLLLQDNIGGLQVLHQNHWVNVPCLPGSLVINFGDLMQLVTNDEVKSVRHRVLNKQVGPRVSVACFFSAALEHEEKLYGPLEELISEESPPIYRPTTPRQYFAYFRSNGQGENHLPHFKLLP